MVTKGHEEKLKGRPKGNQAWHPGIGSFVVDVSIDRPGQRNYFHSLMRSILRSATYLYLVLSVVAGVSAGSGRAVLCLASNGHVAIEPGDRSCVGCAVSSSEWPEDMGPRIGLAGCGPCVDVPVGTPVLIGRHGRGPILSPSTTLPAPTLSAGLVAEPPSFWKHASASPPAFLSSFAPSRTTILRN